MNTEEKIEVMQAWLDGKKIQSSYCDQNWQTYESEPMWSWSETMVYRIKPAEPKKVKLLAFIDDAGCLRWIKEDRWCMAPFRRVPSEDKEVTLCTD